MAEAYVPDPNSPEAIGAWQRSVEQRISQLKLGQAATVVLGYAQQASAQNGIGVGPTDLTGLAKTVAVGTQRLIRLTGFVSVQKHTTKAAVVLYFKEGGSTFESIPLSVDGTTDDYCTLAGSYVVSAPSVGSHTYKLALGMGSGTADATPTGYGPSYLLVEDIGLAPA